MAFNTKGENSAGKINNFDCNIVCGCDYSVMCACIRRSDKKETLC